MNSTVLSTVNGADAPLDAMAWYAWETEETEGSWLLTYVDVLGVILAILVLLMGHMSIQQLEPAEAEQQSAVVVSVIPKQRSIQEPLVAPAAELAEPEPEVPYIKAAMEVTTLPVVEEIAQPMVTQALPDPIPDEAVPPLIEAPLEVTLPVVEDRVEPVVTQALPDPVPVEAEPVVDSPEERLIAAIESRFQNEVKVVRQPQGLSLEIAEVILFDSAKAELLPGAESVLSRIAATLVEIGEANIAVEGHTDNRPILGGRFDSNWDLAAARANRVTRFLLSHGLAAERLRSISYGETQPVADNSSPAGRAANRRVNLRVEFL